MFFIPIGLGQKLFKLPIVTILICLACILNYSIQLFEVDDKAMQFNAIETNEDYKASIGDLYYDYCLSKNNKKEKCLNERKSYFREKINHKKLTETKRNKDKTTTIKDEKKDFSFKEIFRIAQFQEKLKDNHASFSHLKSYKSFLENKEMRVSSLQALHKSFNHLTLSNINLKSLLNAIFSHANFNHLFGNLFGLIVFGIYAEARMGKSHYFLSYLIPGSLAIIFYVLTSKNMNEGFILGASANVYATMGVFYVLFFHHKMKMFFFFFFKNMKINLPIKTYFLLFFIISEFTLLASNNDGVAHGAHAYGFLIGSLYGFLWNRKNKIPRHFLYTEEFQDWKRIQKDHPKDSLEQCQKLLKYNSDNFTIKNHITKTVIEEYRSNRDISKYEKCLFSSAYVDIINQLIKKKNIKKLSHMVSICPKEILPYPILNVATQRELLFIIDKSIDQGCYFLTLLSINCYITKYPKSKKNTPMLKTMESVLSAYNNSQENLSNISFLKNYSKSIKFKSNISNYLIQTSNKEIHNDKAERT